MNIIFLDMDGVMNRGGLHGEEGQINQSLLAIFQSMLPRTDARVVISSTWRYNPAAIEYLRQFFPILDITPLDGTGAGGGTMGRGVEIQRYLNAHPDVEKYAIIDDAPWMLIPQAPNFFKTEGDVGLTPEIAENIIRHFNEGSL